MSSLLSQIMQIELDNKRKKEVMENIVQLESEVSDMEIQYETMLEAQQLLSTVSDDNTTATLDYITGVINKTLAEAFPYDTRRVYLKPKLHAGQYPHIIVILETGNGKQRNFLLQAGTGLRQLVSFLFTICLIEVRGGRKLVVMDELLSGVHPSCKEIIKEIMRIFASNGYQFIIVEYGENNFGKMYIAEKPGDIATITPLNSEYNNEMFVFNKPKGYESEEFQQEADKKWGNVE